MYGELGLEMGVGRVSHPPAAEYTRYISHILPLPIGVAVLPFWRVYARYDKSHPRCGTRNVYIMYTHAHIRWHPSYITCAECTDGTSGRAAEGV